MIDGNLITEYTNNSLFLIIFIKKANEFLEGCEIFMYCPNCGKENSSEDRYCIYCGSELIDNQNFPETSEVDWKYVWQQIQSVTKSLCKKIQRFFKRHPKIAFPVLAAVGCFLALSIANATVLSGESVARRYFKALMNNDSRAVYACLDLPESQFVNASEFDKFFRSLGYQAHNIGDYEIKEYTTSSIESDITSNYYITYYVRGDSPTHSTSVEVVNVPLFFGLINRYKVLSDYISSDFGVIVPAGSTVSVDGIILDGSTAYENYDRYSIPSLFCTGHDIAVSNSLGSAEDSFVPSPGYGDSYTVYAVNYNADTVNAVYAQAQNQLNSILTAAIARQDFPADIVKSGDADNNVADRFSDLKSRLYDTSNNTGFTNIQVTATTDQSSQQVFDASTIQYNCTMRFDYSYARRWQNYWSGETGIDNGTSYGQAAFTYVYEDGVWALESISFQM